MWIERVLRRHRAETSLDKELRFHVDCHVRDLVAEGVEPGEAARRARLELGGVEQVKEQCRDVRPGRWLEDFTADCRHGLRHMRRSPVFTAVAILSLALGIGANTAILGLVNALFLKPMPGITTTDRLVWVCSFGRVSGATRAISMPDASDIRATGLFEGLLLFTDFASNLGSGTAPSRVHGEMVSANYFDLLGVRPALGRWFLPEEDRTPATHAVVVLGFDLWQQRFSGAPDIVGTRIVLNRTDFTVVGVAPRGFAGVLMQDRPPQLWVPLMMQPVVTPSAASLLADRQFRRFFAVGRLRPGVEDGRVRAALDHLATQLGRQVSDARDRVALAVQPVRGGVPPGDRADALPATVVGFVVSGLILLIACANVAGLLVGRVASRAHEIAVRVALGAGRGRLVRQLLTESLLLALVAGAIGLVVSTWATPLLVRAVGVPFEMDVTPDAWMVAATLLVSVLAAITFGLLPALNAAGGRLVSALGATTIAGSNRTRARLQRAFAMAQIALSLVLLSAAGVLLRSVQAAERVERAWQEPDRILTAAFDLTAQGYRPERQALAARELLEAVRALPDVEAASLAAFVPGRATYYTMVLADGSVHRGPDALTRSNAVWPDYFRVLGDRIVRGRDFSATDGAGAPLVAIVNESFARLHWSGAEPVGKTIRFGSPTAQPMTVIGVAHEEQRAADAVEVPAVYTPREQQPLSTLPFALVVRARGAVAPVLAGVHAVVQRRDATLPLYEVATLREVFNDRRLPTRAASSTLNVFGGLALVLASIGIYGLVAWMVERRRREIGVRMALGATSRRVVAMVVAEGLRLGLAGSAMGLFLAVAATRVLSSMVTGTAATDVVMLTGTAAIILGGVVVASFLPARRAAGVEPSVVLRVD